MLVKLLPLLLIVALMLAAPLPLLAGDTWTITTADLMSQAGRFNGLDAKGVRFSNAAGVERTIPLEDFVSVQRAAGSAIAVGGKSLVVLLNSGDRLPGEPRAIDNENLIWSHPQLGEISLPLRRVLAIGRGAAFMPPTEVPRQDTLLLANGDSIAGMIVNMSADKVILQTETGNGEVPLASVGSIAFAASSPPPPLAGPGFRIRLVDGAIITATDASTADNQLQLTLLPPKSAKLPLDQVNSIEQLNGPVVWLSSLMPVENVQTPFLGTAAHWPARMDFSVDGQPLVADGRVIGHGIGVHSYSRLTYALTPGWKAFRTQFAISSSEGMPLPLADVDVRVLLDGQVAFLQEHVRAGTLSPVIWLKPGQARQITMEVDYGRGGDTQDRLNWLEPALLRREPPAPATQATSTPASMPTKP